MLRMGKINYTNILPIYYFFNEKRFLDKVEIIPQIPSQLNRQMENGSIDLGPISSFSYAKNQELYYLLPQLSVSCKGKVRSIFLFSKRPLNELDGASIALTTSSATSVALLKIILEHFHQAKVAYNSMPPSLTEMMENHDAALLIGDDALRAMWDKTQYPFIYDLGEEWHKLTGKGMTFAVWAVRKEVTQNHPRLLAEVYEALLDSKARGHKDNSEMIEELCHSFGGNEEFWNQYFSGLSFNFNEEQKEDLEYFYQLAFQLGLLSSPSRVQTWEPKDAISL
jgi:chorismate dehydratase